MAAIVQRVPAPDIRKLTYADSMSAKKGAVAANITKVEAQPRILGRRDKVIKPGPRLAKKPGQADVESVPGAAGSSASSLSQRASSDACHAVWLDTIGDIRGNYGCTADGTVAKLSVEGKMP